MYTLVSFKKVPELIVKMISITFPNYAPSLAVKPDGIVQMGCCNASLRIIRRAEHRTGFGP